MNNKSKLLLLLLVVMIIAFVSSKFFNSNENNDGLQFANYGNIQYSAHAKCRMDCRNIDRSEIEEILKEGKLNDSKTRRSSKGISYAMEGWSHDKQHIRVVCAPKEDKLVIVTVIDLENNWSCDCK